MVKWGDGMWSHSHSKYVSHPIRDGCSVPSLELKLKSTDQLVPKIESDRVARTICISLTSADRSSAKIVSSPGRHLLSGLLLALSL